MSVPENVRQELRQLLRATADQIAWDTLSPVAKAKHYEDWTRDPRIGGVLARYLEPGQVRVYLKDSLLKGYGHERIADHTRPFRVLGLDPQTEFVESYVKPHGRRLRDGRIVSWGRAEDWKSILMAVHERAFNHSGAASYAAILIDTSSRFHEDHSRAPIEDAAKKLGIERLIWLSI